MISVVFFTNVLPFLLADELSRQDIYCYEALAISEVLHLCETEKIGMVVIDASVEDERAKAIQERWPTLRLKQEARVADVICLTSLPAARSCAALTLQTRQGPCALGRGGLLRTYAVADRRRLRGRDYAIERTQTGAIVKAEIPGKVAVGLTHAVCLSLHSRLSRAGGTAQHRLQSCPTASILDGPESLMKGGIHATAQLIARGLKVRSKGPIS